MPDFRYSPISEYSPTFWNWSHFDEMMKTCTLRGEPAWTNGSIICVGDPPYKTDETISFTMMKLLEPALDREVNELQPVAVADFLSLATVVFESRHIIQARYFSLFREKWPSCRFFGDEAAKYQRAEGKVPPLLVRIPITKSITTPSEMSAAALDSGAFVELVEVFKLVGCIMCLRSDHEQERITEVLEAVKVHA